MRESRFFESFTPLLASADVVRAARIYPGGANLDELIGEKTKREPGWHYPEAWVFSPSAAVNPGSVRSDEGRTIIYDREGESYGWSRFLELRGDDVLGGGSLEITVKMLDGSVTLPKEFHFRDGDRESLRAFPRLSEFAGTVIKPEIWIRHPSGDDDASSAYFGFREEVSRERLAILAEAGGAALEPAMNEVWLDPGEALYVPGGVVHSLGKGLYFEVLADGDLKVTLAREFAGRELSIEDRLDALYRDGDDSIDAAFDFVDFGPHDSEFLSRHRSDGSYDTPFFSTRWIRVPPEHRSHFESGYPHVIVCAAGEGRVRSLDAGLRLGTRSTDFAEFERTKTCRAAIVHGSTRRYFVDNTGDEDLVLLAAFGAIPSSGNPLR